MYKIVMRFDIELMKEKDGVLHPVGGKLTENGVKTSGITAISGSSIEECVKKFKSFLKENNND